MRIWREYKFLCDDVNFFDCGLDASMRHVDAELTQLKARSCLFAEHNGREIQLFLNADRELIAAVQDRKFVGRALLEAYARLLTPKWSTA